MIPPPQSGDARFGCLAAVILAVFVMLFAYHEIDVFASAHNPPASCYLTGGHWNLLTGWNC